jgi:hypothetical protein
LYMDKAKNEENAGIRSALLALNRSWITIANQIERIEDLQSRASEGRP